MESNDSASSFLVPLKPTEQGTMDSDSNSHMVRGHATERSASMANDFPLMSARAAFMQKYARLQNPATYSLAVEGSFPELGLVELRGKFRICRLDDEVVFGIGGFPDVLYGASCPQYASGFQVHEPEEMGHLLDDRGPVLGEDVDSEDVHLSLFDGLGLFRAMLDDVPEGLVDAFAEGEGDQVALHDERLVLHPAGTYGLARVITDAGCSGGADYRHELVVAFLHIGQCVHELCVCSLDVVGGHDPGTGDPGHALVVGGSHVAAEFVGTGIAFLRQYGEVLAASVGTVHEDGGVRDAFGRHDGSDESV